MTQKPASKLDFLERSLESRKTYAEKEIAKQPTCVPVTICPANNKQTQQSPTRRFTVPKTIVVVDLMRIFANVHKLFDNQAGFFLFANGHLLKLDDTMGDVYEKYRSEDLWLHMKYDRPKTFG